MVEEGTVAVVGDVIVKIDAPDAEDMQFKGHDDDSSSKEEPAKEEAPAEQTPVATQTEEVDENRTVKAMPSVRKYAREKVLTLKQFQDLVKWSYYKRRCRCINGGAPTASNESAASASNEEVAETPAAPAAVSLEGDFPETTEKSLLCVEQLRKQWLTLSILHLM